MVVCLLIRLKYGRDSLYVQSSIQDAGMWIIKLGMILNYVLTFLQSIEIVVNVYKSCREKRKNQKIKDKNGAKVVEKKELEDGKLIKKGPIYYTTAIPAFQPFPRIRTKKITEFRKPPKSKQKGVNEKDGKEGEEKIRRSKQKTVNFLDIGNPETKEFRRRGKKPKMSFLNWMNRNRTSSNRRRLNSISPRKLQPLSPIKTGRGPRKLRVKSAPKLN